MHSTAHRPSSLAARLAQGIPTLLWGALFTVLGLLVLPLTMLLLHVRTSKKLESGPVVHVHETLGGLLFAGVGNLIAAFAQLGR